ncbi:hypothetical protein COLO4_33216 [Corchorus olitorius]|uniref:Uncharacterized protein n=1 Tax=Corchorus olitorius TaxID=93759 RepID=A0A1R3GVU5_9ROSI|nr:hypothetical protein COLO4_33216 [Corchorus olitorius]
MDIERNNGVEDFEKREGGSGIKKDKEKGTGLD